MTVLIRMKALSRPTDDPAELEKVKKAHGFDTLQQRPVCFHIFSCLHDKIIYSSREKPNKDRSHQDQQSKKNPQHSMRMCDTAERNVSKLPQKSRMDPKR
eukprot:3300905-Amphidinium_carterae.1